MNFRSDNTAPAAAEIIAALIRVNEGAAAAYGDDQWSKQVDDAFAELFEREVRVFPVSSGTAANAIAIASLTPPWGGVLCHREAHIERDECGAVEFFSGGAKLVLVDGATAKITPASLERALAGSARSIHAVEPSVLSISQTTERGTIYRPDEIAVLTALAKQAGLAVHMDGARFGNAVAALGVKPADLTWRAGVDLLSFGATKNGAIAAEAIVCFDGGRAEAIERRRKRGGHLISKGRFVAAQLLAYVQDGLWLELAGRSNRLAKLLGDAAESHLAAPVESNQVFLRLSPASLAKLKQAGVEFYDWGAVGDGEVRLVVSWNQSEAEIEAMRALLASRCTTAPSGVGDGHPLRPRKPIDAVDTKPRDAPFVGAHAKPRPPQRFDPGAGGGVSRRRAVAVGGSGSAHGGEPRAAPGREVGVSASNDFVPKLGDRPR